MYKHITEEPVKQPEKEIVDPTIRQLLVARYRLLHLYSDFDIENRLPTIEQIRAAHTNPNFLEAVEQKFVEFVNFLRLRARDMNNAKDCQELLFPAEEILTELIKKFGGHPIYCEVSN